MAGGNFPLDHPTMAKKSSGSKVIITQRQMKKITENLREQISQSLKDMKGLRGGGTFESSRVQFVRPIYFTLPQDITAELDDKVPKKKKKHPTTKIVEEFHVSYRIPPICTQKNIDMDNSVLYEASGSEPDTDNKFSFIQRLQNWTLQQRERPRGKMIDIYYYHNTSQRTFGSVKEVVSFMVYEKSPNEKDKKPEVAGEGSTAAASNEALGNEESR